jgi:hypothetical protein
MLTAYFDDSGTSPSNHVAAVAGYVGSVAQWERFNIEWKQLLSEFGVKAMHRSALESSKGEFFGWTSAKKIEFIVRAQKIIKKRTYLPVGSAVIKADFDEVIPKRMREHAGGHFGWCVTETLALANRWAQNRKHADPIDWVFEAGTKGQPKVNEMFNRLYAIPEARKRLRINSWSFRDKSLLPLQAADVVAYETYKFVQNQVVDSGKFPVRLSAIDLLGEKNEYLLMWDKKRLSRWVEENRKRLPKLLGY